MNPHNQDDSSFNYKSRYKYQLAALYDTTPKTLRRWLMTSKTVWKQLDYEKTHILTPSQIRIITEHLGLP
jgi:arsenate reductase-like glutaredoxin family protein